MVKGGFLVGVSLSYLGHLFMYLGLVEVMSYEPVYVVILRQTVVFPSTILPVLTNQLLVKTLKELNMI